MKNFADNESEDIPDYSLFGAFQTSLRGLMLKARAEAESCQNFDNIATSLQAKGGPTNLSLNVDGVLGSNCHVRSFSLEQPLTILTGTGAIATSYNVDKNRGDIAIEYDRGNTSLKVGGDFYEQRLTISQKYPASNTIIAPTLTTSGDLEVAYQFEAGDGVISGSYTPDSKLSVMYKSKDDPFSATLLFPADGFFPQTDGAKLSIKVTLPTVSK